MIDWFLYKLLSTKQKQFLSGVFTQEQKNVIKRIIKPGKKRAQLKKIERVRYRIYNLGFVERGLSDLKELYLHSDDPYLKKLAAWELLVWHANQYNREDASRCLRILQEIVKAEKDKELLRRAAILEAECFDVLGEPEKGRQIIMRAVELLAPHTDLFLAAANLESLPEKRMGWINKAFEQNETAKIALDGNKNNKSAYDCLITAPGKNKGRNITTSNPKVSIIIPAYNAADVIRTSIESMLRQTWTNIELFIVDDCSNDSTVSIVEEYVEKDSRVKLIKAETNGGAYVARNLALNEATGEFVTINDADDWSHSEKIEIQVLHLLKNEHIVGNFSQQARATNELKFYRRGKPGIYTFSNMSSFMFRRVPVMKAIGYWDCVRFAGDSEFVKRVKIVFGEKAVAELQTAPLSFQRQSETSLTSHSAFGFPGYFFGVRKEYAEAHEYFHNNNPDKLRYDFPLDKRQFPVPEPMRPQREEKPDGRRHFDVIIVSEFRLLGGTNMSNIEEIKAQKQLGLRTGLIQLSRYDLNSVEVINPQVRELIDGESVQMLVYGEKVSCDLLILRHPPTLQEWQQYVPDVEAQNIIVIVNQPPKRDYGDEGDTLYEIPKCAGHLQRYFGKTGTWYPIGPLVRETLQKHHSKDLESIELAATDWVNIIDVHDWKRQMRPYSGMKIKIGRHSRDQYVKWPGERQELLTVYPESDKYEVHVLGGAKAPKKILGKLPANWNVFEFGERHPKEFLAELDVFVYFTHHDWVEAFGRVIFEAMAVGVPVIISPKYKKLFGNAAIYAEPSEVSEKIDHLMQDESYYAAQVEKALAYVEEHFGYSKHASRLEEFFHEGK